jgi:uncharacterized protein YjiS (DUF1127 family)
MGMFSNVFFQYWKTYARYQITLQELCSLNDRDLAELGLNRLDIPHAAWEAWRNQVELIQNVD